MKAPRENESAGKSDQPKPSGYLAIVGGLVLVACGLYLTTTSVFNAVYTFNQEWQDPAFAQIMAVAMLIISGTVLWAALCQCRKGFALRAARRKP
jgi:hypothetical protein